MKLTCVLPFSLTSSVWSPSAHDSGPPDGVRLSPQTSLPGVTHSLGQGTMAVVGRPLMCKQARSIWSMVCLVSMYGCESWTIKKAEH